MKLPRRSCLTCRVGAGLIALALLAACVPIGGVLKEEPDATVSFDQGWQEIAPCAKNQLATTFEAAIMRTTESGAVITVSGNYSGSTVMVVRIEDESPGKAKALIHAHDYMMLWGGPTNRAVAALKKCPVKQQPSQ
jgi:hypothetical protein